MTKDKLGDEFSKMLEDNGAKVIDCTPNPPAQDQPEKCDHELELVTTLEGSRLHQCRKCHHYIPRPKLPEEPVTPQAEEWRHLKEGDLLTDKIVEAYVTDELIDWFENVLAFALGESYYEMTKLTKQRVIGNLLLTVRIRGHTNGVEEGKKLMMEEIRDMLGKKIIKDIHGKDIDAYSQHNLAIREILFSLSPNQEKE